jgi:hypothetical protein
MLRREIVEAQRNLREGTAPSLNQCGFTCRIVDSDVVSVGKEDGDLMLLQPSFLGPY